MYQICTAVCCAVTGPPLLVLVLTQEATPTMRVQAFATTVAFLVKQFILKESCDNVGVRVSQALLHATFDPTINTANVKNNRFYSNNTCATTLDAGHTTDFRRLAGGCYDLFSLNFELLLDILLYIQKIWMIIDRFFDFWNIDVSSPQEVTSAHIQGRLRHVEHKSIATYIPHNLGAAFGSLEMCHLSINHGIVVLSTEVVSRNASMPTI